MTQNPVIMFNWKIFIIASVFNVLFFVWSFLRFKYKHAIYRFIAFEIIIAMILIASPVWFHKPLAFHQVFSWIFLVLSIFFVTIGIITLVRRGEPQGHFENTTKLVARGIYAYIRHPLYASLLFLGIGVFIKVMCWMCFFLLVGYAAALYFTAISDEREMVDKFGHEYELYMTHTKMFIPFFF